MKNLYDTIIEKLHLGKNTGQVKYTCHPADKDELRAILEKRLAEDKDADLNDIDVNRITDMSLDLETNKGLFEDLDPHNIDISEWNVSNVTSMSDMFFGCKNFNCDLSNWDVSNVTNMNGMFYRCTSFDCNLGQWNVSNVNDMYKMFYNCQKFEGKGLENWDVSKVENKNMEYMFYGCTSLKNKPSWYKE